MKFPSIFVFITAFILEPVMGESKHDEADSAPMLLRGSLTHTPQQTDNDIAIHEHEQQTDNGLVSHKHEQRKLFIDPDEAAADLAINLGWAVPVAGPLVSLALSYYFDGNNPSVWDQVKDAVELMVTLSDVMDNTNTFESYMNVLKEKMEDYDEAVSDSVKGDALDDLVDVSLTIHNIFQLDIDTFLLDCVNYPDSCDSNQLKNNYYLMAYAVVFAPLHLAILQDQYMYGHYLYCSSPGVGCPATGDIENFKAELVQYAATYQTYFDFMRTNMWEYWRKETFSITKSCFWAYPNFPRAGSTYKTTWKLFDNLGYFDRKKYTGCGKNSCSKSKDCADDQAKDYRDGEYRKDVLEANFIALLEPMEDIGTHSIEGIPDVDELCEIGEVWCTLGTNQCKLAAECLPTNNGCSFGQKWCAIQNQCIPNFQQCWGTLNLP